MEMFHLGETRVKFFLLLWLGALNFYSCIIIMNHAGVEVEKLVS